MEVAAKRKILSLIWLLVAVFQLFFAAQLAPAKSPFVPENRVWKIFSLAAQTHQLNLSQVSDSSSTVRKIELLSLNDLRKDERALALHFCPERYDWSSRNVGGSATPAARTASEALAVS